MQLIQETYRLTEGFPKREMYGMVAQMRRSALSIAANIAEGHARTTTRDFLRFLGIAVGSLRELQTYCDVSLLLNYTAELQIKRARELADETGRMLGGLPESLRRKTVL